LDAAPVDIIERLQAAMNRHDLAALVACFDPDYQSEQPVHPRRGFGGRAQVEANWSALLEGFPDFHAELLAFAVDGDVRWAEWRWTGPRADGRTLDMRGITIVVVRGDRIVSARLYLEEVDEAGADIEGSIRGLVEGGRQDRSSQAPAGAS
jgi:ketosteroid isomerase-like protein